MLGSRKRLVDLMRSAQAALEVKNYQQYIHSLDQLGAYLNKSFAATATHDPSKLSKIAWLENHLKNNAKIKITMRQPLAFCVFEEAWKDEYLKNRRSLSAKSGLNRSTRHNINFGMRALAICSKANHLIRMKRSELEQHDKAASFAIQNYRTPWQQFLTRLGKILAFFMATTCGMAAAATVILTTHQIWPVWAIVGAVGLGSAATMLTNWLTYKNAVPQALIDMLGKDTLFSGWRDYYDKETGIKKKLSFTKMLILAFSSVFALSVGLSNGALVYNFLSKLGSISIFAFLAGNSWLGTLWMNSVLLLTGTFCICATALMLNAFVELLREKNIIDYLLKPLREMQALFALQINDPRVGYKKILTYFTLCLCLGISLFGLLAIQVQGCLSLTGFLTQHTNIVAETASMIALSISLGFALIGQLPFMIESCCKAVMEFARYITQQAVTDKHPAKSNMSKAMKTGLCLVSAAGTGSIVLNTFNRRLYCWLGFTGASWNIMTAVIAAEASSGNDNEIKNAKARRIDNLKNAQLATQSVGARHSELNHATPRLVSLPTTQTKYYQQYFFTKPKRQTSERVCAARLSF